ncbi:hypothetical protein Syun_021417 [Stephania yunnanensis]|uniref:Uncharacterized protein n=1 Tax=Stephania yunnanensis TaxID=152371 RepID=A0AAP0IG17_9MAGN
MEKNEVMEGVGSVALLPDGSISGHFIQLPSSLCYGLHGTVKIQLGFDGLLEVIRGWKLERGGAIVKAKAEMLVNDLFQRKKERDVIVECRGHDAARFQSIDHAHGWDEDVSGMVEQKHGKHKVSVSFECETLKAGKAAEDHIKQFIPKVAGLDAVVNIGRMKIAGLDFDAED